ncbi:hypothetical protein F4805DRAFT_459962 [Annulohypoxylon moriforme]|nr:hypothetical protein F4805DRAFT_459962 [Annulohypoxylon moriforme]
MRSSYLYAAALLLSSINTGNCSDRHPTADTGRKRITDTAIVTTVTKTLAYRVPPRREETIVEVVPQDLFSPTIVIEMLEAYVDLVQNHAIRSNYQLRDAKAASRSIERGDSFGDWWTYREWKTIPKDSKWFDGTLAEGMIRTINSTVDKHVPRMHRLTPHLDLHDSKETDAPEQDIYTPLKEVAKGAVASLNEAIKGQEEDVAPSIDRMIVSIVDRSRRFAYDLEYLHNAINRIIRESTAWSVEQGLIKRNTVVEGLLHVASEVNNAVFGSDTGTGPNKRSKPEKKMEDNEEFVESIARVFQIYVLRFLENEDAETNGTTVREIVQSTYDHFRNGLRGAQEVHRTADKVLGSTRSTLEKGKNKEGEVHEYAMAAVNEMANNLDRLTLINEFSRRLAANAAKLTSDIDVLNRRKADEVVAINARSQGLEPQDDGSPPKEGKKVRSTDPNTGLPITTQYVYEYEIRAPWQMVNDIRKAADWLQYVWSTVSWCEDELAFLNICEAVELGPAEREEALYKQNRRALKLISGDIPSCEAFENPLFVGAICIDEFDS